MGRFSKKVVAAVLAGAAVLLAPVAIHLAQPALLHGDVDSVQIEAEQFGAKMDACSDLTTSCLESKCCKSTGYRCFKTGKQHFVLRNAKQALLAKNLHRHTRPR